MRITHLTKRRTLMNWPMQSYGAEMLRIAMTRPARWHGSR
jgi:hypothetical protein